MSNIARAGCVLLISDNIYVASKVIVLAVGATSLYHVIVDTRRYKLSLVFSIPALRRIGQVSDLYAPTVEYMAFKLDY